MKIDIQIVNPRQKEAQELIEKLNKYLLSIYTEECCHMASIHEMQKLTVDFVLAYVDNQAAGCGAVFYCIEGGKIYGEVKRVYVDSAFRNKGVGKSIISFLEKSTVKKGIYLMRLETGIHQSEALSLYEKLDYKRCDAYGDYEDNGVSVFMEKSLS